MRTFRGLAPSAWWYYSDVCLVADVCLAALRGATELQVFTTVASCAALVVGRCELRLRWAPGVYWLLNKGPCLREICP